MSLKSFVSKFSTYFVLLFFALVTVYPVTRIITISLRPGDQLSFHLSCFYSGRGYTR